MKRLLAAAVTLMAFTAHADPIYHPPGASLVYGDVSNNQSITSNTSNPAAAAMGYKPGQGDYSFGVLSSFGVGFEIGDADNLFDEIDATAARLDTAAGSFGSFTSGVTAAAITDEIDRAINDTNNLLSLVEEDGYAKAFVSFKFPVMPIVVSADWLGGSLTVDVSGSGIGRAGVLHDPIDFVSATLEADITTAITGGNGTTVTNGDFLISNSGGNINFTTAGATANDSTVVLKAAYITEAALGYSRQVWNNADGKLFAGLRGKYYKVELLQAIERIIGTVDSETLFDDVTDLDRSSSSGIGIDIGTIWMTPNYHLGATFANLNEPAFDYNAVDTSTYATNGKVKNALNKDTTYTMESQLKLEGAIYSKNKHWVLGAALDANEITDPVGDEYKWAVVSGAYISDSWYIPSGRLGYRKNMAGSNLSYITFGATWLKVNLDVAYSPDKVEVDGSSVTRSVIFNMGLNISF